MAEPIQPTTGPGTDREAMMRASAEFAAQRSVVFRPAYEVGPSALEAALTPPAASGALEVARQTNISTAVGTLLSPQMRGTPQQQAVLAATPAANAGVSGDTANPEQGSGSSGVLANAVEVLSALTNQPQDVVRKAIVPEGKGGVPDLALVRKFMGENQQAIANSQTPESLARMSQSQRDAVRTFLGNVGYPIKAEAYGATPEQQGQALSQGLQSAQQDLGMDPANMLVMLIVGMLAEAFGLQGAFQGVLGMTGGSGGRGMRTGSGGMGTTRSGAARFSSEPELDRVSQGISGRGTIAGVVNLANALDGQAEVGNNGGAIVRATMGYTGDPWCGGFVRYAFEKAGVTGVYDQADYRSAQSYMRIGKSHGAFRSAQSGYQPQAGDVLVFGSSRGPGSGHVGIVVARNGDQVTYVSGNDSDAVRTRTISLSNPPAKLFGYTDTEALARSKGVHVQRAPEQVANPNVRGTTEALGRTG